MFPSMTALVDCNSFYASCERVFRPSLRKQPVLVLSNNDGCVIARTQEVKDLGIGMGVPYFTVKDLARKHNVQVFSSNYALYGDMSRRVMHALQSFTPEMEVYSIDEAFLSFKGFQQWDLEAYGVEMRAKVLQYTGIPTSVGMAPTKVLAKVANHLAKKNPAYHGVCILDTTKKIENALQEFPVQDLWGIGRNLSFKLGQHGISTAKQFRDLPEHFVRKTCSVQGHRLLKELKGIACLRLQKNTATKKQIISTRSFGKKVYDLQTLQEAIASHISNACIKLRKQNQACHYAYIFIQTARYEKQRRYRGSDILYFTPATASTHKMIKQACKQVKKIYKQGYAYKKCGVHLSELVPSNQMQRNFFAQEDSEKDKKLMMVMDQINQKQGATMLQFAACGTHDIHWAMQSSQRSPCYTTRWNELLKVR